jgi:hypothetical protein
MTVGRLPLKVATIAALTVAGLFVVPGVASAAPAFDPNNDGAVTLGEVLDAPLLPASLSPGIDSNGDGALSIGEAFEGRIPTNPKRCLMVDDGFICP